MKLFKEVRLHGTNHGREFSADIRWLNDGRPKPVILFLHGFKGFKDWGTFGMIADDFANAGYVFVKMNMSHNGVTPDSPVDFVDLEAFSENTFSREMEDIRDMIDYIKSSEFPVSEDNAQKNNLILIGHSRGGASALMYAATDERVQAVCGWAALCDPAGRWQEDQLRAWKNAGVVFIPNARTGQDMPMKYAIVEDYYANESLFNIPGILPGYRIPVLLIHGTNDQTVPLEETQSAISTAENIQLRIIEGADHVFGAGHPYSPDVLPPHTQQLLVITKEFLKDKF